MSQPLIILLRVGRALHWCNRKLKSLSVVLGRPASLCYAITYLLLIPAFACVYSRRPDNFYHATLMHEGTLLGDGEALLKSLRDSIVSEYRRAHQTGAVVADHWRTDIGKIKLSHVRCEARKAVCLLTVEANKATEEHTAYTIYVQLSIDPVPIPTGLPHSSDRAYLAEVTPSPYKFQEFDIGELFTVRLSGRPPDKRAMPISGDVSAQIQDYVNAHEGRPGSTTSGGFARMLYFSAITITTLGYGDILPLTAWARTWVGIEAVAGVVLIGLFLNALAQEMAGAQRG